MQEEVENKSVNLAIRSGSVTARGLYLALKAYLNHQKSASARRSAKRNMKQMKENMPIHGKQSVKQLVRQGQGVSSMDIGDSGLRDFKRIANKYGADFAIVKDKESRPPKYMVFFKAKDADAITAILKEYSQKQLKKKDRAEKPSIREKLRQFKEKVASTPKKEKRREIER